LQSHAAGCITAMANLFSPFARQVFDAFQAGNLDPTAQTRLDECRAVMNRYPPAPPLLKALLQRLHGFPAWSVRPPLVPLPEAVVDEALASLEPVIQGG
jgi:dihydrodipicolinate synthase/N-acetylneuraminate lyase